MERSFNGHQRAIGEAIDIAESNARQNTPHLTEQRFRHMAESSGVGMLVGDDRGVISYANDALLKMLGFDASDLAAGRLRWDRLTPPEFASKDAEALRQLNLAGVCLPYEKVYLAKDNHRVPILILAVLISRNPAGAMNIAGFVSDLTRQKQTERQLQALNDSLETRVEERSRVAEKRADQLQLLAAKLTSAERQERKRLAKVIHDHLQQLLVAARLQMGVLRKQSDDFDLLSSVQNVDDLVLQALEVSRTLTVELSPPVLHDGGLEAAIRWLAREMLEKNRLEVAVEADTGVEPESEEIKLFLFEAVRELLFNIVKHAGVDKAQVRLRRTADNALEVVVEDQGAGLTLLPEGDGGLGLFNIRQRLEPMGGRLDVVSTPGQGTRVTLRSPMRIEEPAVVPDRGQNTEERAAKGQGAGRKPLRVLLADDHKILREGLVGLLELEPDIEVVGEASDGQMALEMARAIHPDVVIMDVTMPRLNGVEATRRIRAEAPDVRVIALSMHGREDMAAAMRQAGACAYFTKGGPSELLISAIRACAAN